MASVNFLYRSTKQKAHLIVRLLYRHDEQDFVYGTKTKYEVTKEYWEKQHTQKRPKDIEISNLQTDVKTELNKIENYIINAFHKSNPATISKEWLVNQMDLYYNPVKLKTIPKELIPYIDTYIEFKKSEVTESTIKKCKVIKQLLIRYQENKETIYISNVDNNFKLDFENYCLQNNYAPNTIARAIRFIKTICKHAKFNGIETNFQLDNIKVKYVKTDNIYLTPEDITAIEKKVDLPAYLENAKDWLLISCFTGQRISDFMRFNKNLIRYEKNKYDNLVPLIEFTQKKTDKIMTVPLWPEVINILKKRNGDFPKSISDQKYNDYIKEVCKLAGLTEIVKGSKKSELTPNSKIFRKDTGMFEKWELVSSHIGRRSFATNNYGQIPTSYLTYVTGHSTESMFLQYIGKSNKDIAMELTNYIK
ncbi:tyrosine-type recombinase/integrase [Flavobacterium hauense]|jgi:integrase